MLPAHCSVLQLDRILLDELFVSLFLVDLHLCQYLQRGLSALSLFSGPEITCRCRIYMLIRSRMLEAYHMVESVVFSLTQKSDESYPLSNFRNPTQDRRAIWAVHDQPLCH